MRTVRAFSIITALVGSACAQVGPSDSGRDSGVVAPPPDAGGGEPDAAEADAAIFADAAVPADGGETRAIEPAWTSRGASPADGPGGRWGTPFVYVADQRKFYLFGGSRYPNDSVAGDTWTYSIDDQTWSLVGATNEPGGRYCFGATHLPDQNQILLVGGRNDRGPLPQGAWTLDLATNEWTLIDGPYSPGIIGPSVEWMPNYPGGGRAVIFGGTGRSGLARGTWSYDPVMRRLEEVITSSTPPSRQDAAMAYDPGENGQDGRLLLFSGGTQLFPEPKYVDELWEFDGLDWRPIQTLLPRGRRSMGSVFDSAHREWIIFSGTIEDEDLLDLWIFDARQNSFMSLPVDGAPPPRGFPAFSIADEEEELYLYGGLTQPIFSAVDDVWSLRLRVAR